MSKKNYNKISTDKVKAAEEVVEEIVEEVEVVEEPEITEPECFEGKVVGCAKLNVRA